MSNQPKQCIFKLYNVCHVVERSKVSNVEFGSLGWVQMLCTICIKATYARRFKTSRINKYTVVNTL